MGNDSSILGAQLNEFLKATGNTYLNYLLAIAALGVVSMSVVQAVKNLLYVRYFFQRHFLRRWLTHHAETAHRRLRLTADVDGHSRRQTSDELIVELTPQTIWRSVRGKPLYSSHLQPGVKQNPEKKVKTCDPQTTVTTAPQENTKEGVPKANPNPVPKKMGDTEQTEVCRLKSRAEHDILLLAADGNAIALYDADGDEFCKRLGTVAQLIIDFPDQYRVLLGILACNADVPDYDLLTGKGSPVGLDQETLADANASVAHRGRQRWLDARNRVRLQVVQAMAAFELRNQWWWVNTVKTSAFLVSFGLSFAAFKTNGSGVGPILVRAAAALLAAFLAPVARDLVAAIQNLRSK